MSRDEIKKKKKDYANGRLCNHYVRKNKIICKFNNFYIVVSEVFFLFIIEKCDFSFITLSV